MNMIFAKNAFGNMTQYKWRIRIFPVVPMFIR